MQMIPVSSSNLSSVGYKNGTLHVRFNSGWLYAYYNVPENVFRELMAASSHGSYHARHIKNVYPYERIG